MRTLTGDITWTRSPGNDIWSPLSDVRAHRLSNDPTYLQTSFSAIVSSPDSDISIKYAKEIMRTLNSKLYKEHASNGASFLILSLLAVLIALFLFFFLAILIVIFINITIIVSAIQHTLTGVYNVLTFVIISLAVIRWISTHRPTPPLCYHQYCQYCHSSS